MHSSGLSYRGCDRILVSMNAILQYRKRLFALLAFGVILFGTMITPRATFATGSAADAICFEPGMCQYGTLCGPSGPPGVLNKPCKDTTNKFTTPGVCVAQFKCLATGAPGQNGGMEGLQQALQALQQMMQQMKGGGGGGGGSGSGTGADTGTGPGGCTQYYNVTAPSSDPCAVYVPPVSDSLGSTTGTSAANDLISSLLGGGYANSNVPTQPAPSNGQNGTRQSTSTTSQGGSNTGTQSSVVNNSPAQLVPGVSGDIQYSNSNVTVVQMSGQIARRRIENVIGQCREIVVQNPSDFERRQSLILSELDHFRANGEIDDLFQEHLVILQVILV